jgi:protein phosphatase
MESLRIPPASLVVLCGPAGAGKSSWAARHFPPTRIVSSDDCRARVSDDPADQSASVEAFELFHTTLRLRARLGRTTVADSTALKPEARRELLGIARDHGLHATLVLFDLPAGTCIDQNARRERAVPEGAVREHAAAMPEACEAARAEGWDRVVHLRSPGEAERLRVETAG